MRTINLDFRMAMLCCFAVAIALSGCSGGNGRQAVSGSVTLDGQPVANGAISFRPIEGTKGSSAGGAIKDGNFTIAKFDGLLPGKYAVTIQTFRETGRMIKDPQIGKPIAEIVPVRFREEGSLNATVSGCEKNEYNYVLTTVQ